jgi:flagellar biosynthesis protein FliR
MKAPGFSHPATPKTVRVLLAVAFALGIAPALPMQAESAPVVFALNFAREFVLGAGIGISVSVLYDGAYSGGRALDDYLGVKAAMPAAMVQSGSGFGRLWSNSFLAAFFLLGGVESVVQILARIFMLLPPGSLPSTHGFFEYAIAVPRMISEAALAIVGPAIAMAFFVQIALAGIGRIVPRFSTFALSFPVVFGAALFLTIAAAPAVLQLGAHPWIAPWNHV